MPFSGNSYTPPNGATNAFPGEVIASATWNSIFTDITSALTSLLRSRNSFQRSVTASPVVIALSDQILTININTGSPTCALPAAASRNGMGLTFKDVGGHFNTHNLTITPNGAETIDGSSGSLVLTFDRQGITLVPFNDGVNTGWFIL